MNKVPSYTSQANFERGNGWDGAASIGFYGVTTGSEENKNFAQIVNSGGGYFTFHTNNNGSVEERLKLANNGFVGIGISAPAYQLDVNGNLAIGRQGNAGVINFRRGTDGWVEAAKIGFNGADEGHDFAFKLSSGSGAFTFHTNNNGSVDERLRITSFGNIGIGTTTPDSKLTVAGKIHSREVQVSVDAGADFVFEEDYELTSLEELDQYVKENKHLPEIASAKEMESEGIHLAEMNIKLLQKIEELTLHMIEQNNQLHEQKSEISKMKAQIKTLMQE
ncbi:MAG: hypothetical protein ABJF04_14100 [Reichenbachiella sp.]|uniref:hypothetical protein n=1 Tax=Reichenbachiella sp. TaxID=2184521 RepID=UPI0032662ABE